MNKPTPESPPVGESKESKESKPKRGGKRRGAGRKPNYAKRLLPGVKPVTAAEALEGVDVRGFVHDVFKNGSRSQKLQYLSMLWDCIYGRPRQEIGVSGGLVHAHTRDPQLALLPKEALEALARAYDDVLAKHVPPVLESTQDAPPKSTKFKASHRSGRGGASRHSANIRRNPNSR